MNTLSYRFLRRKFAWLIPETIIGRLTWYVGLLWAGTHIVRQILIFFGSPASQSLDGWASTFNFIFFVFVCVVGFRWMRRNLLWRVRNRLIVTYMFIGVIPVVLILGMIGISGYLISNQYATSQARVELDGEVRALQLACMNQASRLAEGSPKEANAAAVTISYLSKRFPELTLAGWRNGKPATANASLPQMKVPDWTKGSFHGVVIENGNLFIRTVETVSAGKDQALVLISVPVTKELLDRTIGDLGEAKLHTSVRSTKSRSKKGGIRITQKTNAGANDEGEGQQVDYDIRSTPAVTGGIVPKAMSTYWDPPLDFHTVSPYRDWATGEETLAPFLITTRLSALGARLFANTGPLASAAPIMLVVIAGFFALIELGAIFFGVGLTRTITKSVANLYLGTQHINRGDFKFRINVKSNDQLASLQTAFNSMAQNLEKLIIEQKEKERLESELAIAQEVQATLFPRETVDVNSLELHGVCRPARTVSGDYYDFLPCGTEQLGIALGDISGKGISAALLMATIHSAVRAYEYGRMPQSSEFIYAGSAVGAEKIVGGRDLAVYNDGLQSPAVVLELLNRHLFQSTQAEKYATLFLGVYDGNKRSLTYTNAGHLPPLIIGEDGSVHRLETGGMVIGLFDGMTYEQATVTLRTNDIFVAYSDGITEPENEFGEFGEERLIQILRENRRLPLAKISELVISAVQDWIGADTEQPDDVTLVLARVR
jgi:sigma-B regulation protein RsbU (phosphoserine phosphatase)